MEDKLGIWGNEYCLQCGACCYKINQFLEKIDSQGCSYLSIKGGQTECIIHHKERRHTNNCNTYFCGDPNQLQFEKEQETLRQIAFELGTAPKNWKENTNL